jgi:hypothetical protein
MISRTQAMTGDTWCGFRSAHVMTRGISILSLSVMHVFPSIHPYDKGLGECDICVRGAR